MSAALFSELPTMATRPSARATDAETTGTSASSVTAGSSAGQTKCSRRRSWAQVLLTTRLTIHHDCDRGVNMQCKKAPSLRHGRIFFLRERGDRYFERSEGPLRATAGASP